MIDHEHRKISIAIPYYNSYDYLEDALRIPLLDPRVDEIMLFDDGSSPEEFKKAETLLAALSEGRPMTMGISTNKRKNWPQFMSYDVSKAIEHKVTWHGWKENHGAWHAKLTAVKGCRNEWVLLLDGDNYLVHSSLDCLFSDEWNPTSCYQSGTQIRVHQDGQKHFDDAWDYHSFLHFGCEPIDLPQLKKIMETFNSVFPDDNIGHGGVGSFLNNGNYFVNRDAYTKTLQGAQLHFDPKACDGIVAMRVWLQAGNNITVIPGFSYVHRIREDSWYGSTSEYSGRLGEALLLDIVAIASGAEDYVSQLFSTVGIDNE